ncbi:MAG: DUF2272 domain-containing protein [Pseudoxanthomonas sp.]
MKRIAPLLLAIAWLLIAAPARAGDPCPQLRTQTGASDVATRIAAFACQENLAWFRPFIDADGRSSGQPVYEAENDLLADGVPAWKKVAAYWNGSGLGGGCAVAGPACRNYVVDSPWSAAFVSWVMRRARLPGFTASARHVDYVRAAWRQPARGPYRLAAPGEATPAPGDLLCYVRVGERVLGHRGLLARLDGNAGLPMHCDIVVAATPGGLAWTVGGNVQQAVTLRMLRLDAQGRFTDLPLRGASDLPCSPDMPAQCNLNRQDWAALLKLRTDAPASLLTRNADETPARGSR